MIKKNDNYDVTITGMTSSGEGVGKIDGFAIFIPETAVGDVVNVKILKVLKSYGYAKVEKIIKPSAQRIAVDCDCYTKCGGCTYRHISYSAELECKQSYVESCFKRIAGIHTNCDQIIGSKRVDFYRNKAQLPVGVNSNGDLDSGFYAKRSHRIISCDRCYLQSNEFTRIKQVVLDFISSYKIQAYDETSHKGIVRHIYIRKAEKTNEIMVCIVATSNNLPHADQLVASLTSANKDIVSIILNVNSKNTNVILGDKCITLFGKSSITDIICDIKINISPLAFYQVNRDQAEILYYKALELAQLTGDELLIDLYCGTGTIGLIAASRVRQVIGIEVIGPAIENALSNATLNNIYNIKFICADAKYASQQLAQDGLQPDVIIVDPPRKGLDIDVISAIAKMNASRVVMISCNPSTAARDTGLLVERGYSVEKIQPVDMFPRTSHVECVCLLTRKEK